MTEHSQDQPPTSSRLDLSSFPPIYVLPTHMLVDEVHAVEDELIEHGASLTYDLTEAKLVLGKIQQKRRARIELRSRNLWTEERDITPKRSETALPQESPRKKKRLERSLVEKHAAQKNVAVDDSSTASESEDDTNRTRACTRPSIPMNNVVDSDFEEGTITVIKVEWLQKCLSSKEILPLQPFITYHGKIVARHTTSNDQQVLASTRPSSAKRISIAKSESTSIVYVPKAANYFQGISKADLSSSGTEPGKLVQSHSIP